MPFKDLPHGNSDDQDPDAGMSFRQRVALIFPDAASSRLARIGGVNGRTAQKWLSGEAPVPQDVADYVEQQYARVHSVRLKTLEDAVERASADGVDAEVIAAHLSLIYAKLTGQKIR
ncbi:MAG TPA: hypothetical protein DIT93_14565 [Pelagibacterium sp.]|nr:hypothetical protein [Pelagibacterium sp.]|tara:strand:- start:277 stop:627 length:351 start_codon:yes stop_codon:yes gene_type:complete